MHIWPFLTEINFACLAFVAADFPYVTVYSAFFDHKYLDCRDWPRCPLQLPLFWFYSAGRGSPQCPDHYTPAQPLLSAHLTLISCSRKACSSCLSLPVCCSPAVVIVLPALEHFRVLTLWYWKSMATPLVCMTSHLQHKQLRSFSPPLFTAGVNTRWQMTTAVRTL